MKPLKYFIIAVALIAGFSSCMVESRGPGYYHPRPHYHHHHHGHGYYR
ncbi:hypothetical protein [Chitinophaga sp. GbtcB8]|nr:hypothetical protein [Chitinophaga sp. GbtcB8]